MGERILLPCQEPAHACQLDGLSLNRNYLDLTITMVFFIDNLINEALLKQSALFVQGSPGQVQPRLGTRQSGLRLCHRLSEHIWG